MTYWPKIFLKCVMAHILMKNYFIKNCIQANFEELLHQELSLDEKFYYTWFDTNCNFQDHKLQHYRLFFNDLHYFYAKVITFSFLSMFYLNLIKDYSNWFNLQVHVEDLIILQKPKNVDYKMFCNIISGFIELSYNYLKHL